MPPKETAKKSQWRLKALSPASAISEFHTALGQFLNYRFALSEQDAERKLYLAVPNDTYSSFFAIRLVQNVIQTYGLKIITYNPDLEVIVKWIK